MSRLPSLNILLVTPSSPLYPANGTQQRSALLYDALCSMGRVHVLGIHQGASNETATQRSGYHAEVCWRQGPFGWNKYRPETSLTRLAEQQLPISMNEYDVIVGRYLNPISKLDLSHAAPTLVDLDDLGYAYPLRSSWALPSMNHLRGLYGQRLAARQLTRFSHYLFLCARDRERHPDLPGDTLPNIPYIRPSRPEPPVPSNQLLFVGSLWYRPNQDGINYFLTHVWPRIRTHNPEATLLLAGAAPTTLRERWSQIPGVHAPGFVQDLEASYRDSAAVIAPIYSGGGTNIKVLEAVAHRRPCIVSPFCYAGFAEAFDGYHDLYVAGNDSEFVTGCLSFLSDQTAARRHTDRALEVLDRHYSLELYQEILQRNVRQLLAQNGGGMCQPLSDSRGPFS